MGGTLVVVGNGMVGHRLVQAVRDRDTAGAWQIVVLGEESRPAYDRVALTCGDRRAISSRGSFAAASDPTDLPIIIADVASEGVAVFPRETDETSIDAALLRAPTMQQREGLTAQGIKAILRVPFKADGLSCEFCCENRSPRQPSFELHAAAELFAQMFAMRLAIDEAA